jgi:hypothetical protein
MVSKNDAGYWILDKKLTFICVIPHPASSIKYNVLPKGDMGFT